MLLWPRPKAGGNKSMSTDNETIKQIAEVIDEANYLEMRMGLILSKCICPVTNDYGFLVETVIHNSIISFGAKVLLIKRILDYWGWSDLQKQTGKFDDVLRMRNAFAHTPTDRRVLLVNKDNGEVLGSQLIVESKEGRRLENIERKEAFDRFKKAFNSSISLFEEIEAKILQTIAQPGASADT
jgi:hypothetical protein